jgi:AcrR family transcriptional regulator
MTDKTEIILTAATNMFARYGYTKTTIGDILVEAGVARQTLYNTFSSKEEILRAVVRRSGEDMYAAVMDAWSKSEKIEDKLSVFHKLVVVALYETIQSSPDWEGLIEGLYQAAADEMASQEIRWRRAMSEMFKDAEIPNSNAPLSQEDIVDFFQSNSMNAKHGAKDIVHLKQRLKSIRIATVELSKL